MAKGNERHSNIDDRCERSGKRLATDGGGAAEGSSDGDFDTANEILDHLQTPKVKPGEHTALCPYLVETIRQGGYYARPAATALQLILEDAEPGVEYPELFYLYGQNAVDTELADLITEHLCALFPPNTPSLPVDIEPKQLQRRLDMAHLYRAYRVLSYMPPDGRILAVLSKTARTLGDSVPLPGIDSNPQEWLRRYARRIISFYGQYPDRVDDDLVTKATRAHRGGAIREAAPYIDIFIGTHLQESFSDLIDGGRTKAGLRNSGVVDDIIECYLDRDLGRWTRSEIADLVTGAVSANYMVRDPTPLIGRLVADIASGGPATERTAAIADAIVGQCSTEAARDGFAALDVVAHRDRVADSIDVGSSGAIGADEDGDEVRTKDDGGDVDTDTDGNSNGERAAARLALLRTAAGVVPKTVAGEGGEHVDVYAQAARSASGRTQECAIGVLTELGQADMEYLSDHLGSLMAALGNASSAEELGRYGTLLTALNTYPPPQPLLDLYRSTDDRIADRAKAIARTLRTDFRDRRPAIRPGMVDSISELAEDFTIKYEDEPGVWRPLNPGGIDRATIESVIETLGSGESSRYQLVFPYYDTRCFAFVLLALALSSIVDPDTRYGVFSPGTPGRWGTKGQLTGLYSQLAIDDTDGLTASVTPLFDLVPPARISHDGIIPEERSTTIDGGATSLSIVKDWQKLAGIEDQIDALVHNYLPKITGVDAYNLLARDPDIDLGSEDAADILAADGASTDGDGNSNSDGDGNSDSGADRRQGEGLGDIARVPSGQVTPSTDTMHIECYTLFTERSSEGWRQGIGPPVDARNAVCLRPNAGSRTNSPGPADEVASDGGEVQASGGSGDSGVTVEEGESAVPRESSLHDRHADTVLNSIPDVTIHAIETDPDIAADLRELREIASYLDDVGNGAAVSAIYRIIYAIEGLPVPVGLHDSWVSEQRAAGNFYVPMTFTARRHQLRKTAEETVLGGDRIADAVDTVEHIFETLRSDNPLFGHVASEILDAAKAGSERVAVLCAKKTYKDMFAAYFQEGANIDLATDDTITLVDEDSVRKLEDVDTLVAFGIFPPQTAIYCYHPAVDRVMIAAYDGGWTDKRIHGILDRRRPFLPASAGVSLPEFEVGKMRDTITVETSAASEDDSGGSGGEAEDSFSDDLYRTYFGLGGGNTHESRGEASGSPDRYRLEFGDGSSENRMDIRPVIIRSDQELVSSGEFVLRHLYGCKEGDEMVTLDEETYHGLWEAFLHEHYDNTGEDFGTLLTGVELWYDAIESALEATTDKRPWNPVANHLNNAGVSELRGTIVDWLRSVDDADGPRELIFRPDLRLGPRQPDAVRVVAEEYGSERMVDNWEAVHRSMRSIRAVHRKRGHGFWKEVADSACRGDLFDRPGARVKTITAIERLDSG